MNNSILRFLPDDQYQAAMNANAPTALNPFATIADIPSSTNIYTNDGTITDVTRTVTINNTLQFNHGAAGVGGNVLMQTGGYFKNSIAPAVSVNTHFEYNHTDGKFKTQSDVHTVTGFKATRIGTGGNPTADVELFAGSNGDCYMQLGATTSRYFTYVNGVISQAIYVSSGAWSIGNGLPDHAVGLTVYGKGGTAATSSQIWKTSVGTEVARMNDAAQLLLSGKMAIGAAVLSPAASHLEVSGDMEVIGIVKGLVLTDRTLGTRHRLYLDNGSFYFEAA